MAVPILKQGPFLIASIQSALTDTDVLQLRDDVMAQVTRHRSRGIIVDVTALDVMDSFVSRSLRGIAMMTRLRGAIPCQEVRMPDMAGPYQTSPKCTLVRKY